MAQQVPAAKPKDLSAVTGTHMKERANFYKLSSDLHMCMMTHKHTHTYICTQDNYKYVIQNKHITYTSKFAC